MKTNLEALATMTDDEIDCSDIPALTDEELDEAAWFVEGPGKTAVYFSVDTPVLEFFRKKGSNYLTLMSDVLRDYAEANSNA